MEKIRSDEHAFKIGVLAAQHGAAQERFAWRKPATLRDSTPSGSRKLTRGGARLERLAFVLHFIAGGAWPR